MRLQSVLCLVIQYTLKTKQKKGVRNKQKNIAAVMIKDERRTIKRKKSWKTFPIRVVFLGKERGGEE